MKKEPSGKILIVLGVWAIIAYAAFPFPVNLIIGFIGLVVIVILVGLAEYFAEKEEAQSIESTEGEELPPISEPKKKTKSSRLEKHRPRVKVELEDDKNNEWRP